MTGASPTALLFPGQGAQVAGMLDRWVEHDVSRHVVAEAAEATGLDLVALARDPEALRSTEVVQPVLLAAELAGLALLQSVGVAPVATAGHSLGEYAALVAAGVLSAADACRIVVVRGRAMAEAAAGGAGTMTAVLGLGLVEVAEVCERARRPGEVLAVANDNGAGQVVIAGSCSAVDRAEALVRASGGRASRLAVAGAFHTPLMAPAVAAVAAAVAGASFRPGRAAVVPNVTGVATRDPDELRHLLARHVVEPVQWAATMAELERLGVDHVIEVGPGRVLTGLAKRALPAVTRANVAEPDDVLTPGPVEPTPQPARARA